MPGSASNASTGQAFGIEYCSALATARSGAKSAQATMSMLLNNAPLRK